MARLDFVAFVVVALCCAAVLMPAHAQDLCTPGVVSCSQDCSQVLFCLSDQTPLVVDTCPSGWLCDSTSETHECVENGICVQPTDPDEFECHALGYFPHPFDCTKFHLCFEDNSAPPNQTITCPSGTAYDALTTRCSLSLGSRPCTAGPVPKCIAAGQFGAQVENPNIYFVCVRDPVGHTLVPELYKCPVNEIFVGTECVLGKRRRQLQMSAPAPFADWLGAA